MMLSRRYSIDPHAIGRLQVVLSGVAFGFLGWFGKIAYTRGIAPGELLSLRFLTSSALLGAWLLAIRPRDLRLKPRELLSCIALGTLGYAVFSSCYFTALTGISASLTVLLLYLYPVFVTLGGWLFFRDPMGTRSWAALAIALTGLVLLVWGEWQVRSALALAFGVGSAVFYSFYILAARKWVKNVDPQISSFWIQLAAGVSLFAVHFSYPGAGGRAIELWAGSPLLFLGIAVICTWIAITLFLIGVQKLKSSELAILSMTEPLSGVGIAILFLAESLSLSQIIGGGAVLAAMWLSRR